MKLTIKTETLARLLNKVSKCSSNNKMLPLTCMTEIQAYKSLCSNDYPVCATTTNGSDYINAYLRFNTNTKCVDCNEFKVVVNNDVFYKLVAKTTVPEITLEVVDQHLVFTGNGKYTMELPVDENGELVKFPEFENQADTVVANISKDTLDTINKINKANLSTNMSEPCYTNYYLGEQVLTSDRSVICSTRTHIVDDAVLINPTVMSLLDTDVIMYHKDKFVTFHGPDYMVLTKCAEGLEDFDADAITTLVNHPLDFSFNISKTELLNALDRLGLFINVFDKNCLSVNITKDKMTLSNMKSNSSESIAIKTTHNYKFNIDIEMFRKIISVMPTEVFELQFGSDLFIKLVTDKVVEIVPLLVE